MDINKLREAIQKNNIEWRKHTLIRLAERNISQDVVLEVILEGEVIENYPKDRPFFSCLMFKVVEGKPFHVMVSLDEQNQKGYIITTYEPTLDNFESEIFQSRLFTWSDKTTPVTI